MSLEVIYTDTHLSYRSYTSRLEGFAPSPDGFSASTQPVAASRDPLLQEAQAIRANPSYAAFREAPEHQALFARYDYANTRYHHFTRQAAPERAGVLDALGAATGNRFVYEMTQRISVIVTSLTGDSDSVLSALDSLDDMKGLLQQISASPESNGKNAALAGAQAQADAAATSLSLISITVEQEITTYLQIARDAGVEREATALFSDWAAQAHGLELSLPALVDTLASGTPEDVRALITQAREHTANAQEDSFTQDAGFFIDGILSRLEALTLERQTLQQDELLYTQQLGHHDESDAIMRDYRERLDGGWQAHLYASRDAREMMDRFMDWARDEGQEDAASALFASRTASLSGYSGQATFNSVYLDLVTFEDMQLDALGIQLPPRAPEPVQTSVLSAYSTQEPEWMEAHLSDVITAVAAHEAGGSFMEAMRAFDTFYRQAAQAGQDVVGINFNYFDGVARPVFFDMPTELGALGALNMHHMDMMAAHLVRMDDALASVRTGNAPVSAVLEQVAEFGAWATEVTATTRYEGRALLGGAQGVEIEALNVATIAERMLGMWSQEALGQPTGFADMAALLEEFTPFEQAVEASYQTGIPLVPDAEGNAPEFEEQIRHYGLEDALDALSEQASARGLEALSAALLSYWSRWAAQPQEIPLP